MMSLTEQERQVLGRCHLAFYPEYGLLRCLLCAQPREAVERDSSSSSGPRKRGRKPDGCFNAGVMTKNLRVHMRGTHGILLGAADVELILNKFWLPENRYFQPSRLVLPAIGFLPVLAGYECQECPYRTTHMKTLRAHYKNNHANMVIPEARLLTCSLQSLAPGPLMRYFKVDATPKPPPVVRPEASSLVQAVANSWNRHQARPLTIPSQIPRILVNLCWTSDLFGEHREILEAYPKSEEDDPLAWANYNALDNFFFSAMRCIEQVDANVLFKLREDADGFRPLQQMKTVDRYTSTMARFVLFALNCHSLGEQSPVLIDDSIKDSLERLQQRLLRPEEVDEDGSWRKAVVNFLHLLYFSRAPGFSSSHLIPSFIRLECTTATGNAKSIDEITHTCSYVNPYYSF